MPFLEVNGLGYHYQQAGSGPALLLLHGFTGSLVNWAPHIPGFTRHFTTISVDLPGHGQTQAPTDPARHGHEQATTDLASLMSHLGLHRFHLLGYSMGGRMALALALAQPQRLCALVLESASPGIADAGERAARRLQDESLARHIELEGVRNFVAYWEQLPMFASQRQLPAEIRRIVREQRLKNSARGLAGSLRGAGAGAQASYWSQLPQLRIPTLLLTGALDTKFCAVAARMAAANPGFRLQQIVDAGHCIHLEQPQHFQRAVLGFLNAAGDLTC